MSFIYYFQTHTTAFLTVSILLGFMVGSFLNVVILRLPIVMERNWRRQCLELFHETHPKTPTDSPDNPPEATKDEPFNLMVPRSRCPNCAHTLSIFENIPIISYLLLRGRCSACHAPISPRYPLIELLGGVMAGGVAWQFGVSIHTVGALVFGWALIALAFIDLDHQQLPDEITLPVLWIGLAFNLFGVYAGIEDSIIGAIFGYGILWSVYQSFRLLTGKEGMGYGDFKLLAMIGAWLGWQALPVTILISSTMGALVGLTLILLGRHHRNVPIPFGPYLSIAAWIALLWGNDITQWYLGIWM
uniref:Prepilin leader peptidase/N-methyltransferase n=1 Tax=Candidatus Kentrum sp. TUN TaxID=2126343 RepID=A0A450ZLG2_9GAMM|nr:MAG: type 4 prepilin peptidase 1 . Aspartic peptidase. MEROPS family A24A [Candidatus Kentron sp. TUN]VFK56815.1 MAG: type 4 prepilin peptidase 1 . Aspartic peptidase. MEROPS family A24A [Candidatus Kentron sp. TUN]